MKNIRIMAMALLALPLALFTSCLKDDDDVFSENASTRLQEALTEAQDVLRGAPNGWVMDYYVGDDQVYGGYAYIIKFDSLTCTATCEKGLLADTLQSSTSYYKMTSDNGPTLTFDTYNEVLHALATPANGNYEAYHADFEFLVLSATPEKVVLKGKRVGNVMTLVPLQGTAEDYLDKVQQMQDKMIVATAEGQLNGKGISANLDLDSRWIEFTTDAGTVNTPFVYTDKGIRLYRDSVVTVDGKTVTEFAYDNSTMQFTCLDSDASSLVMQGALPATYVDYADYAGDYTMQFVSTVTGETSSLDVTLEPLVEGQSFKMKGLFNSDDLYVTVNYSKSKGALELLSQVIGQVGGVDLWFNAVQMNNEGRFSFYLGVESIGMQTEFNTDRDNPVYYWSTNDNGYLNTNTFCLITIDNSGDYATVNDQNYMFKGDRYVLNKFHALIKK